MSDTEAPTDGATNADVGPIATPPPVDASPKEEDSDDNEDDGGESKGLSPEEKVRRARSQTQKLRERLKEAEQKLQQAEPLVKKAQAAEEANKTEIQRALERAEAAEKRELEKDLALYRRDLADEHNIPRNKLHLLGSGSREEMEAIAAEIGPLFAANEKTPAPPTNRPVEGLKPGASPEPPKSADDSYPASWRPPHLQKQG